jgi:hypothetical protein
LQNVVAPLITGFAAAERTDTEIGALVVVQPLPSVTVTVYSPASVT